MSDSPYTEGWPIRVRPPEAMGDEPIEVIPLSDAERMRKALDAFGVAAGLVADRNPGHPDEAALRELEQIVRDTLNPEYRP